MLVARRERVARGCEPRRVPLQNLSLSGQYKRIAAKLNGRLRYGRSSGMIGLSIRITLRQLISMKVVPRKNDFRPL